MRKRRNADRALYARAASAAGDLFLRVLAKARNRPVDSMAICAAAATSLTIIVNAVFLQSGSRPAPYFATPRPQLQPAIYSAPVPVAVPQPIAVRHNDPIAELIGPSPRIAAVQRALSDYGYGQIKPSGMLDEATADAIEKFEREHKLPVSGRVSERLVTELAGLVGHPIE